MTPKEYLSQAFYINRKIDVMIKKAEEMKRSLYGKSINYENDGTQSGNHINVTETALFKVLEYEERINAEIDRLVDLRLEIENAIMSVNDDVQREVLERRYLLFEKWEKIAVEMNIDLRWIYRLHKKALLTIESHYCPMLLLQ